MESINCFPSDNRRLMAGIDRFPLSLLSAACGVGQYPDSGSDVGASALGSSNAMPFDVTIPDFGQVSQNVSKQLSPLSQSKTFCTEESDNVFNQHPSRLEYFANPVHFWPEPSFGITFTFSFACMADSLARKSTSHHIHVTQQTHCMCPREGFDVIALGHIGPVLGKNLTAVRVDLNLVRTGHACTVQAEINPPNTGEKGHIAHRYACCTGGAWGGVWAGWCMAHMNVGDVPTAT